MLLALLISTVIIKFKKIAIDFIIAHKATREVHNIAQKECQMGIGEGIIIIIALILT